LARTVEEDLGVPLKIERLQPKGGSARPRVLFFNRDWGISGVNTFTETVIKGLIERGIDAELVFPCCGEWDLHRLPDVPLRFLHLEQLSVPLQWRALIDFAEANAPCILVPNYDYLTSAICPVLSDQVGVVGIVHSHDVEHYDHVDRLGRYWNRIICVTDFMMNEVKDINPSFVKRMRLIPYGIEVPEGWPERSLDGDKGAPIRLIYTGRLVQHQKRVRDLVKITKELTKRGVPHLLTVIGEGKESERLQQDWAQEIADGTVVMTGRLLKHEIVQALRQSDVFVLVSDFEGLPLSLLE